MSIQISIFGSPMSGAVEYESLDAQNKFDETLLLTCKTFSHFDPESFSVWDKTRNAVLVPREAFDELQWLEDYGYARAFSSKRTNSSSEGTIVQVTGFSTDHDTDTYSTGGVYQACVRSTMQDRIGVDSTSKEQYIHLRPCHQPSVHDLNVERVRNTEQADRDIVTHGSVCYIHEFTRRKLGVNEDDTVEVLNPQTGGRICLPIKTGNNVHYSENWVRLDRNSRKLIGVEADKNDEVDGVSRVTVRVPADLWERSFLGHWKQRAGEVLGKVFIDYSTVHLQVITGRDNDEDRNTVRMNADTMKSLGISEHDRVVLSWNARRESVRCLTDVREDETKPLEVRVPSTERDKLEVSLGDCVSVRRDMRYAAGKQMAFSVLGILAVLINADILLNLLGGLATVTLLTCLSILVFHFIMLPNRQKCR